MTDTATADPPPATDARSRLRAAAAKRTAPAKRRTTARKSVARNVAAAKRGKYADRIVPAIKTGAALLGVRNPVQGAILARQAEPFAAALERVAAEDARVDAFLVKVSGLFGKGGAWGELGTVAVATAGAMMIAGGTVPAGPLGMAVAFIAGDIVQGAAMDAAADMAEEEIDAMYGPDRLAPSRPTVNPDRVRQLAAELLAPKAPPAGDDESAGDEATTDGDVPLVDERGHVPVWGR